MKKTTSVYLAIGLFIAGLTTLSTFSPLRAQNNPHQQHIAVLMLTRPLSAQGPNHEYIPLGQVVWHIDASPGVSVVPEGTSAATAIAYYLELGCRHQMLDTERHLFER